MQRTFVAAMAELFKLGGARAPPEEALFYAALLLIPATLLLIVAIVALVHCTSGPALPRADGADADEQQQEEVRAKRGGRAKLD